MPMFLINLALYICQFVCLPASQSKRSMAVFSRRMTYMALGLSLIIFFLLALSVSDATAYSDQIFFRRQEKTYLSNHVFQTVFVEGEVECGLECAREDSCLSVNFGAVENGLDVCELNNVSIDMSSRDDAFEKIGFTNLGLVLSVRRNNLIIIIFTDIVHSELNL